MSRTFCQVTMSLAVCLSFLFCGCGGGVEADKPANLTPEQEQEILKQVKEAAMQESSQPQPPQ